MRFRTQNHGFLFKQIMKHRVIKEPVANIPAFLADKDIDDPRAKRTVYPKWTPTVTHPNHERNIPAELRPDYRAAFVYEYGAGETRLHEGEQQALVLTNSVRYEGLPKHLSELAKSICIADQDQLVQEAIMQSHVWDATSEKLPRRFNKDLPGWRMKAEKGIPQAKIISSMYKKLIRICENSLVMKDLAILTDRALTTDNSLKMQFTFQDKTVLISSEVGMLSSSREPMPSHCADPEVIEVTSSQLLPDLYPISPLINLRRQHFHTDVDQPCFKSAFACSRPHTLFISVNGDYSPEERNGEALMLSHAHALIQARQQYGNEISVLPSPISVQCVVTDGSELHFLCYQLNTASAATTTSLKGIKNQAWFDCDNALFRKLIPKRSMLRNTNYVDYDAGVFRKFAALYSNGLQL